MYHLSNAPPTHNKMTAREYWIRAGIESGMRNSAATGEWHAISTRPGDIVMAGVMGECHVGHLDVDVDLR
jgi:hypothetical protein